MTREEAATLEKHYIRKFGTLDQSRGYNLHEGGFPVSTKYRYHVKILFKLKRTITIKKGKYAKVDRALGRARL